jgi:alpha-ribazole phosphatase
MNDIVLYLIRHGKTYCNEERLYCGRSDVSLSEKGIEELKALKESKNYPICKLNYTSGANRANETFEILYGHKNYQIKKDFFEYNFGDFELKSYEILKENKDYINWITDNTEEVCCPNGESKVQFYKRIKVAFEELLREIQESSEKEALLLCHGGTIGTLLWLFYDNSKNFYEHQPSCGGGYKLKVSFGSSIKIEVLEEF